MIKNYIRKIVKEVLAEKVLDHIKEFIIPGVKSMLQDERQKIDNAFVTARNAYGKAAEAKLEVIGLKTEVERIKAKLDETYEIL